jgi:undecaprenyl-diphosphatase
MVRSQDRRTLGVGVVLPSAGLPVLVALAVIVSIRPGPVGPDEPLWSWFVTHRGDALTLLMRMVSALTAPLPMTVAVCAIAICWVVLARSWWAPTLLVAAVLLATLVSRTLKAVIGRERPPVELALGAPATTPSFPSGHTVGAATLALVMCYLLSRTLHRQLSRWWWAIPTVVIAAVMTSRLYLGRHWLTDVVAGLALAVAVLGVVVLLDLRYGQARPAGDG